MVGVFLCVLARKKQEQNLKEGVNGVRCLRGLMAIDHRKTTVHF